MSNDFFRESSAAVSSPIDIVSTLGRPADWVQAAAAGAISWKDGGGIVTGVAAAGVGDVFPGPIRSIQSSAAKVRYGTGPLPIPGPTAAASASAVAAANSAGREATFAAAFGDFAALGAGVKTKDYTVTFPTGARMQSLPVAEGFTGFDDAAHGTYTATLGTSAGGNQIGTSINLATGQTGFPKAMTAGASALLNRDIGGETWTLRITSSVDLNTVTVGAVTVKAAYFVPG